MTLYQVEYTSNDYSSDRQTAFIAASSAMKAAEFVGRRRGKFVRYSGRVTSVTEVYQTTHIAK